MGKFDKIIGDCEERRKIALEDIADFEAGRKIHINDEDVTPKWLERAKRDVDLFDRLIAAYTEQNE